MPHWTNAREQQNSTTGRGRQANIAHQRVGDAVTRDMTMAARLGTLQRLVGNRAVSKLVAGNGQSVRQVPNQSSDVNQHAPTVQREPGAPPFEVSWSPIITYGTAVDKSRPREDNLIWTGDTFTMFGRVSLPNAKNLGLKPMATAVGIGGRFGDATMSKARWVSDTTVAWDITGTTPGKRSVSFNITAPDGVSNERWHDVELTIGADPRLFKDRCSSAESVLNTLHAAGREWFMKCFLAYKQGYANQSAALEEQAGTDRLAGQLLLGGVLLAGGGGAVGGLVGGAISHLTRVEAAAQTIKYAMGQAAFTDAAKDLTKYLIRLPTVSEPKTRGGAGPSTDPAVAGQAGKGEGAVAAVDPENWMATIDAKIAHERTEIGARIVEAHLKVDAISVKQPSYIFDWDPVEVVSESATIDGKPITDLGPVPTALEYERACWEVWLENYAYKLVYHAGTDPLIGAYGVEGNVGRKLKKRIDAVAQKFGESGDAWIRIYGAKSKEKREAERKKRPGG